MWFEIYESVVGEVKATLEAQGRSDEFIGSKIIYSTMRDVTLEDLEWHLEDCLALKQEFPHLVAGFDLVGHEDSLNPLLDFVEPFQRFVKRQQDLGVHIPFILHAGETTGDGTNADVNLYDAILLGTKRIGHGYGACLESGYILSLTVFGQVLYLQTPASHGYMPGEGDLLRDVPYFVRLLSTSR